MSGPLGALLRPEALEARLGRPLRPGKRGRKPKRRPVPQGEK